VLLLLRELFAICSVGKACSLYLLLLVLLR
jgi:hypothetical protein